MAITKRKQVLTTGQMSRICEVAPRTVSNWVDSGALKGYRIPGSRDRRIPVSEAVRFMRAHGMPIDRMSSHVDMDAATESTTTVLVVGAGGGMAESLRRYLPGHFVTASVAGGFDAGAFVATTWPACVVIDLAMGRMDAGAILASLRSITKRLGRPMPAAVAIGAYAGEQASVERMGFDCAHVRNGGGDGADASVATMACEIVRLASVKRGRGEEA